MAGSPGGNTKARGSGELPRASSSDYTVAVPELSHRCRGRTRCLAMLEHADTSTRPVRETGKPWPARLNSLEMPISLTIL
jgi:hypothetical protein